MQITITPEQKAWLEAHVARGEFTSIEEAVQHLKDERMIEDGDDLAWAKPYLDEARAELDRDEYVSHDALNDFIARRLDSLRGS